MRQNQKRARNRVAVTNAAAGAAGLISSIALTAPAWGTDYIYSPNNAATDVWSSNTRWSPSRPSSASTAEVTIESTSASGNFTGNNTNTDNRTGNFSLNILDLGGTAGAGSTDSITLAASGSAALDFVSNGSTTPVINLVANDAASGGNLSYNVSAPIVLGAATTFMGSGTASFTFSGSINQGGNTLSIGTDTAGTFGAAVTFTGATTSTGNFFVEQGTGGFSGTSASYSSSNFAAVGENSGDNGTLVITNGAHFTITTLGLNVSDNGGNGDLQISDPNNLGTAVTLGKFYIGKLAGGGSGSASGAVSQTGGTLTVNGTSDVVIGGSVSNSSTTTYGVYDFSGGTFNSSQNLQPGGYNYGQINMSGNATLNHTSGNLSIGRYSGGYGVVTVGGDATLNDTSNTTNVTQIGEQGTGTLNILGGTVKIAVNANASNQLSLTSTDGASTGSAEVNLNAGILKTESIGNPNATTTNPTIFSFNGGTLQATGAGTATFLHGLGAAYVYPGGGIIDTQSFNDTISQALLAPTGNGVTGITLASGGAGYFATPIVALTGGGGTGASAVANLTNGVIASITITNPGIGYTSAPTVALYGGNPTTAASVVNPAVTEAANLATGGITKIGNGTLTLTGANTYAGPTTVSAGALTLARSGGGQILGGALTAAANTSIAISGNNLIAGGFTFAGGLGAVNMQDGVQNTLTVGGALNFSSGGSASLLLDETSSGFDTIAASGNLTIGASGLAIGINDASLPTPGSTYNIITFNSESPGSGAITFASTGNSTLSLGGNETATLHLTATAEQIIVTGGTPGPATAYWVGGLVSSAPASWAGNNSSNSHTNFTTDLAGGNNTLALPGYATNVIFSSSNASSGNLSTTLDQNVSINSLTFNGNVGKVTISSGTGTNTLTVQTGGITVNDSYASSNGPVINANVALGSSQTWTNNTAGSSQPFNDGSANTPLLITGNVSGSGALTIAGQGGVILAGVSSTYGGGTTVSGGRLAVASALGLGSTSGAGLNIINNGAVFFVGSSAQVASLAGDGTANVYLGATGYNPASGSGATVLTVGLNNTSTTYAGTISDGGVGNGAPNSADVGSLVMAGTGTLALTGSNSYVGGTTISAGTIDISSGAALGASGGALTLAGGTLQDTFGSLSDTRAMTLTASSTLDAESGTLSLGGDMSGSGAAGLSLIGTAAGVLSGNLTIGGYLNVTGAGQWTIGGNDTAGNSTVDGALFAAGNSSLQVSTLIVGNAASANGNLTLGDGNAGAEVDLLSGNLTVGNKGNGTLVLQNGSALEIDNLAAATVGLIVAANSASTGTVIVTGNSALDLAGSIAVGNSSSSTAKGTIQLTGGGTLSDDPNAMVIYSGGTVILSGGSLDVASIDDSHGGNFTFVSGSLTLSSSNLAIGNTGSGSPTEGLLGKTFNDTSGDAIAVSGTTTIASDGSLTINGGVFATGALVNNGAFSFISGSLDLTNSDLNVASTGLLGNALNLVGNQSISVSGNTTVASGGALTISGGALDTNTLVNNGTFTLTSGYFTVESNLLIDSSTGTFPSVAVPANSFLGVGGTLTVGESAIGSLTANAGATFYAGELTVGDGNGSSGTITFNGTQGAVNDLTIIGNYGNGAVNLLGGSSLTTNNLFIAQQTASTSALQIGGNSNVVASGFTTVGGTFDGVTFYQGGKGTVSIAAGSSLETIGLYVGSASTVSVNGSLILNGAATIYSGGRIGGGGTISASFPGSSLTLISGATITGGGAGAGPAKLTSSAQTWNGGATYLCNIASATGSIGVAWDDLSLSSLALVNASSSTPFTVQLVSLGNNTQGQAVTGFNPGQSYSWTIAQINAGGSGNVTGSAFTINGSTPSAGVLSGLASSDFALNTTSFSGENNVPAGGTFQLDLVAINSQESDLVLNYYVSAPEPATATLMLCAAPLFLRRRRRRA